MKPNFAEISTNDIEQLIKKRVKEKFDALDKDFVSDCCAIGNLMTKADDCYEALKVLNGCLKKKLFQVQGNTPLDKGKGEGELKQRGLLSGFFNVWEATFGFNAKATLTPTLTGFVRPDNFKAHLLQPGYHWKDPGVGVMHGEFSHRIQWYIVTQRNLTAKILKWPPLKIFEEFAQPNCSGNMGTIWDDIVDATTKTDFRTPDKLHSYLNDPEQLKDDNVDLLAQLISGRTAKRKREKEHWEKQEVEGAKDWYHKKLVAEKKSFKEGPASGIVWKQHELHSSKKIVWDSKDLPT